jgi:UDP-GlcNAc3NAcA epimerase
MKLLTVIGARPQFVKAAAVSRTMSEFNPIKEILVHTGQHFDANMSDIFFQEMEISKPNYSLKINNLSHGAMTGRMIEQLEQIMTNEKPDAVMVYGDTNSTLAGALAAAKLHIPILHVEAGLRSFNAKMPEEINRILTDRISTALFCPTETAISNLKNEGFDNFDADVLLTGDVMEDAALYYSQKSQDLSAILTSCKLLPNDYVLCTIHRQENTDDESNLRNLVEAINNLHKSIKVVLPLHPRTVMKIKAFNLHLNALILPPVGYFDMLELIKHCKLVLTDSGGLQKEAYFFEKFCITLREETEWLELVQAGYNILVGTSKEKIKDSFDNFNDKAFNKHKSFYGGGQATKLICQYIAEKFAS